MLVVQELDELWAVIGSGELTFRLPRALLPREARAGDVVRVRVEVDAEATAARRRQAARLAGAPEPGAG